MHQLKLWDIIKKKKKKGGTQVVIFFLPRAPHVLYNSLPPNGRPFPSATACTTSQFVTPTFLSLWDYICLSLYIPFPCSALIPNLYLSSYLHMYGFSYFPHFSLFLSPLLVLHAFLSPPHDSSKLLLSLDSFVGDSHHQILLYGFWFTEISSPTLGWRLWNWSGIADEGKRIYRIPRIIRGRTSLV